jgi:hypothetical protein
MLHEFEALLFVDPDKFEWWVDDASIIDSLHQIKESYSSPKKLIIVHRQHHLNVF